MAVTTARVLQINVRLYSLSKTDGHPWDAKAGKLGGTWPYRVGPFCKMLSDKRYASSIIAVQECDQKYALPSILNHLAKRDGQSWRYNMRGKVGVLYNAEKWRATVAESFDMDNADEADRRVVVTRLQSVKTGQHLSTVSTHFGVHFDGSDAERIQQAATVAGVLKGIGVQPSDPTVIFGDFNDDVPELALGVRRVFMQEGYRGLRERLSDEALIGNGRNTHHGWKPTKRDGVWIDDILTSSAVTPLNAEVVLTDPVSDFPNASDHNAIFARLRFGK